MDRGMRFGLAVVASPLEVGADEAPLLQERAMNALRREGGNRFGMAVETDVVFPGNPLRVCFEYPYQDILSWIAQEDIGYHWMAAYGDWRVALSRLEDMVGCSLCVL